MDEHTVKVNSIEIHKEEFYPRLPIQSHKGNVILIITGDSRYVVCGMITTLESGKVAESYIDLSRALRTVKDLRVLVRDNGVLGEAYFAWEEITDVMHMPVHMLRQFMDKIDPDLLRERMKKHARSKKEKN